MGEQDVGDGVSREHLPRSAGVSAADRQGKKDLEEQNDEIFGLVPKLLFLLGFIVSFQVFVLQAQ
jgi:hypothetical protein